MKDLRIPVWWHCCGASDAARLERHAADAGLLLHRRYGDVRLHVGREERAMKSEGQIREMLADAKREKERLRGELPKWHDIWVGTTDDYEKAVHARHYDLCLSLFAFWVRFLERFLWKTRS